MTAPRHALLAVLASLAWLSTVPAIKIVVHQGKTECVSELAGEEHFEVRSDGCVRRMLALLDEIDRTTNMQSCTRADPRARPGAGRP